MKTIKDIFDKRKRDKYKKEEEYREKIKTEAEQAKKEIKALKELQKDQKTLDELRNLRTKLKPKPKWSKNITNFFDSIDNTMDEIDKVNKKILPKDNNKQRGMFNI